MGFIKKLLIGDISASNIPSAKKLLVGDLLSKNKPSSSSSSYKAETLHHSSSDYDDDKICIEPEGTCPNCGGKMYSQNQRLGNLTNLTYCTSCNYEKWY